MMGGLVEVIIGFEAPEGFLKRERSNSLWSLEDSSANSLVGDGLESMIGCIPRGAAGFGEDSAFSSSES